MNSVRKKCAPASESERQLLCAFQRLRDRASPLKSGSGDLGEMQVIPGARAQPASVSSRDKAGAPFPLPPLGVCGVRGVGCSKPVRFLTTLPVLSRLHLALPGQLRLQRRVSARCVGRGDLEG